MWAEASQLSQTLSPLYVVMGVVLTICFAAAFVALAVSRGKGRDDDE